ncbi:MAG: DUF692 family multinuclear iron-containing protein [Myxococcota bacterium]
MTHPGFRTAVEPLLAAGAIDAVEWTVDLGFGRTPPPSALAVCDAFGAAGRLYGHGVGYSPLSAGRDDVAAAWLGRLAADRNRYRRLSEHFGWCTGGTLRGGAPLPVPRTPATLAVGQDRLRRLQDVAGVEIGLENLALALSRADALDQGPFVAALLAPVDGYVHLDLHNLWCQIRNFDLDPDALLATWPLDRVRVVHVSGGSWVDGVRRDTHDDRVPAEVWDLVRAVLPRLPGVEAVFLERIGASFGAPGAPAAFAADFAVLRGIVDALGPRPVVPAVARTTTTTTMTTTGEASAAEVARLATFQADALAALGASHAAGTDPVAALGGLPADDALRAWLAGADPRMVRVAEALVARWAMVDPG